MGAVGQEGRATACIRNASWELALREEMKRGGSSDAVLHTTFLIMAWDAMRYSDVQRVNVAGLDVAAGVLRGACWQTKTSACQSITWCLGYVRIGVMPCRVVAEGACWVSGTCCSQVTRARARDREGRSRV